MAENPYATPETEIEPVSASSPEETFEQPQTAVLVGLAGCILASVLNAGILWDQDGLLASIAAGNELAPEVLESNDMRVGLSALAVTATLIVTAILWGMWSIRAAKNARAVNPDWPFEYSPKWTVGWFFVPFANWFYPHRAVQELFHASGSETAEFKGRDTIVSLWWGAWLVVSLAGAAIGRLSIKEGLDASEYLLYGRIEIAVEVVRILCAIAAIKMIQRLNGLQLSRKRAKAGA